ncbi:hypothetical protein Trydic_g2959 [Trypoxylus dichotomus]
MADRAGPLKKKEATRKELAFHDDAIARLQVAIDNASDSSEMEFSDDDSSSTVVNSGDETQSSDDFRPPSGRQQRKRKSSRNSGSEDESRKRSGAESASAGRTTPQPIPTAAPAAAKRERRIPPVVLREKGQWMRINAEIQRRAISTTKVVNTRVGIRIQPATAADYRKLVDAVTTLGVPFHSFQLTEEKPLKVVLRGVPEEITEEEVAEDLLRQGFRITSCKRMTVGPTRLPIPLVFVELKKSEDSKKIFSVALVCGIHITVESKLVKKDQVTQCHRCQLYGHGQRNCHAAPVCVKCAGPHPTAECRKPRDAPAKCALCLGPHTANYGGCPRAPRATQREVPARSKPITRAAATKPAQRTPEPRPVAAKAPTKPPTPAPRNEGMEVDTPAPSTSNAKPSYAAAVRKTVTAVRKTAVPSKRAGVAPKKPKNPKKDSSTPAGPKPKPKKPADRKPATPAKPTTVDQVHVRSAPTTRSDPASTLAMLIPLLQKINWTKLIEVATALLPQLLECRSGAQAGLVLASRLQDILAIFSNE